MSIDLLKRFTVLAVLAVSVSVSIAAGTCIADAPRVVKATPDDGDQKVDPKLDLLVVEFDQDMDTGGQSLCGIQKADVAGEPRWKGKRVFEIPIKLKPSQKYQWSVNCPSFRNFKSEDGESAVIYPLRFKTAAAGKK